MNIPNTHDDFCQLWANNQQHLIAPYLNGQSQFIPHLLPELAVKIPTAQIAYLLERKLGQATFYQAINPNNTVDSPVKSLPDGQWLKTVNMVGINVRTIQSFWNVVKYSLTLPASQSSIHLLPIWECGVVASLYGMAGWNINPEFYDAELASYYPHLDTVEKQLKVVVNILHALGKTVGMDVIPHTDRYSEIALANPQYFEWLQRKEFEILNHEENLHLKVQERIFEFLQKVGASVEMPYPDNFQAFFDNTQITESDRILVLFGQKKDLWGRNGRRNQFISYLFEEGYEPVPATMAPPYRGLAVDPHDEAKTVDEDGRVWRDYVIAKPQAMSRVFGPLGRFKLHEAKNNNADWEIDFEKPRVEVWEYVANRYLSFALDFNFDFMRGDMSHVQMRPEGTPENPDLYYDIHKYIKHFIRQHKPSFGYFAESFLAPPNEMAYGVEEEHLEGSDTDSTLGDLQSMVVGSPRFIAEFARYHELAQTRSFAPNFTIMTADKDDPRFDEFYLKGNELRLFMALFLTDMPSYMSLGYEQRDPHPVPAPNENYTKLYVFQLDEGPKATHGPYIWGKNGTLFHNLEQIKVIADQLMPKIIHQKIHWLISPSAENQHKVIAWKIEGLGNYVFLANLDIEQNITAIELKGALIGTELKNIFSTFASPLQNVTQSNGVFIVNNLLAGECKIFEL